LNGQLSVGESICQDFGRYLKSLEAEGRCVFLPYQIQSLHLRNIGKFVEKHLDFYNGNVSNVTVILGDNGSGKSTIIRAISSVVGSQNMVKDGQRAGEINLTHSDGRLHLDIYGAGEILCIALDDNTINRLDRERYSQFLNYLRDLDVQLILTINNIDDDLDNLFNRIFPDCNFIQLN
jgi:predicted ATP-binding protein involved in virulence